MKKQFLVALMDGDTPVYSLVSFDGHISRVYPNGKIGAASEEDKRSARYAEQWLRKCEQKHHSSRRV